MVWQLLPFFRSAWLSPLTLKILIEVATVAVMAAAISQQPPVLPRLLRLRATIMVGSGAGVTHTTRRPHQRLRRARLHLRRHRARLPLHRHQLRLRRLLSRSPSILQRGSSHGCCRAAVLQHCVADSSAVVTKNHFVDDNHGLDDQRAARGWRGMESVRQKETPR